MSKGKNKSGCIGSLIKLFAVVVIVGVLVSTQIPDSPSSPPPEDKTPTPVEWSNEKDEPETPTESSVELTQKTIRTDNAIPGIAAVDIHGNLTDKGFKLVKRLGGVQSEWSCKLSENNCEYSAEAFGSSASEIHAVRGTVVSLGTEDVNKSSREFLGYLASLPYERSDPAKAKKWVHDNIGMSAETTIGGVKFEIFANAPRARILRITKQPAE